MSGFVKVKMGDRIRSLTIQRSDVPAMAGARGRAILLDPNPRACNLGYDKVAKTMVFCDQESAIKYKLSPRTYYVLLLGRLSTTMKGEVIGDEVIVEYLQLSDKIYEEFMDVYREMDNCNTILLKKEQSSPTFAYVKPIPSKDPIPDVYIPGIQAKLSKMNLDQLWAMIENNMAKTVDQYEEILRNMATNPQLSQADRQEFAARAQGQPQLNGYTAGQGIQIPGSKPQIGIPMPGVPAQEVEDVTYIQADSFDEDKNSDFDDFKDA